MYVLWKEIFLFLCQRRKLNPFEYFGKKFSYLKTSVLLVRKEKKNGSVEIKVFLRQLFLTILFLPLSTEMVIKIERANEIHVDIGSEKIGSKNCITRNHNSNFVRGEIELIRFRSIEEAHCARHEHDFASGSVRTARFTVFFSYCLPR